MKTKSLLQKLLFSVLLSILISLTVSANDIKAMDVLIDAPVAYAATNVGPYSFTASWSKVSGASFYVFYVARKSRDSGLWENLTLSGGNTTNTTSVNLTVPSTDAEYKYHVVAYKDHGIPPSANSNVVFFKTKLVTPVLANEPVSVETQKIVVKWTSSSYATDYKFYLKETASGKMVHNGISTERKILFHVNNLESGLQYEYWVKAVNESNESDISEKKKVTTIAKPIPVALSATNITTSSFTARWNAVAGAQRYRIELSDMNVWQYFETTNLSNDLTINLSNLKPNSKYQYRVRAIFGWSIEWDYLIFSYFSNTVDVSTKPDPPVALSASNITETSFTANWQGVQGATGFKLWVISKINTGANPIGFFPKSVVNTSFTIEGLQVAHSYQYYVQVVTPNGESAVSNFIDVDTKPLPPNTIKASGITSTSFNANWNTTLGATSYLLRIVDDETQNFVINDLEVTGTQYKASGLKSGSGYRYSIKAKRNNTITALSNWTQVLTAPPIPVASTATNITKTSFTANWKVAKGATHYLFFVWTKADNRLLPEYNSGKFVTSTSFQVTGLNPNTEYGYNLYAVNNYESIQHYSKSDNTSNEIQVKTLKDQIIQNTLTLSVSPVGGGNVEGSGEFAPNTAVTARAIPGAGYEFMNWTEGGTEVSISPTFTFNLNANRTLTANFRKIAVVYNLITSANPTAGGKAPGTGGYFEGTEVKLFATPNAGYEFVNWTEGATIVSTNVQYNFTITSARTLVANFKQVATGLTLTLNENPTNGGDATGGGIYTSGTSVTLKATPFSGYEFVNWTEGASVVSTLATYTFSLTANRTLTANFKASIINYSLSLSANPSIGGTASGGGSFINGKSVMVSATPQTGYEFENWTENGVYVSSTANYTFNLNGNRNLTANFRKQTQTTYTLSINSVPFTAGSATGSGSYASGTKVIVTALPNRGYDFVNWTKAGVIVSTSATYNIDINENTNLIANFSVRTASKTFEKSGINVYPNPVTDVLNVSGIKTGISIGLYSVAGKLVLQKVMVNEIEKIDFTNLTPGVYFMKSKDTSLPAVKIIRK